MRDKESITLQRELGLMMNKTKSLVFTNIYGQNNLKLTFQLTVFP